MDAFEDVEVIPEEDAADLSRFEFLDDSAWPGMVGKSLSTATIRKVKTVVCVFNEWRLARNRSHPDSFVPEKELVDFGENELCQWLPYFLHEIRRKDGAQYRAKTIFEFLLCIQTAFEVQRNVRHCFLKDTKFVCVKNACDNVMKALQKKVLVRQSIFYCELYCMILLPNLGNCPKKVDVVTELMEDSLWNLELLGSSSPKILLRTLVFSLGLKLGLRKGEHRLLRRNMFEVSLYK